MFWHRSRPRTGGERWAGSGKKSHRDKLMRKYREAHPKVKAEIPTWASEQYALPQHVMQGLQIAPPPPMK